jgi:hypothetical protein
MIICARRNHYVNHSVGGYADRWIRVQVQVNPLDKLFAIS